LKRIAVDIGGTFTDIVCIDEETMEIKVDKAQTTPSDLVVGVLNAVSKIIDQIDDVSAFLHGSTVAANALVERKGAKIGLITTQGFRDILEIRRVNRPDDKIYDIMWEKPQPLVPRYLRHGVNERIRFNGEILKKLDRNEVVQLAELFKANGIESIAVCLLHSYANPEHEQLIRDIIQEVWPDVYISLSSEVSREIREYERTSTTVLDAYIKKPVVSYLKKLDDSMKKTLNLNCDLLIASSAGGVSTVELIEKSPIQMISSGPAGGAIGARYLGEQLGIQNLLTADVGGTTFDVSLVVDGKNNLRNEAEILGYIAKLQSIDVRSVGAGGGSIAYVDEGGMLHVGPESAGADPGPMCYGKGGLKPTVTDAAVVTGLIDPDSFAGGEIKLDVELARKGIGEIAEKLKMDLNKTAEGILTVARNTMADVARQILVSEGYDPRDFTMVSFGGGGGLFATEVAQILNIPRVIIPPHPAVFSAWGMLAADVTNFFTKSYVCPTNELDIDKVNRLFAEMEDEARSLLKKANIKDDDITFVRAVDTRYQGQGHEIEVPLPIKEFEEDTKQYIDKNFDMLHEAKYGHKVQGGRETVTFRLRAFGKMKKLPMKEITSGGASPEQALTQVRNVFLGGSMHECPIYSRERLLANNVINGLAIVEEPTHITVVLPGQALAVDKYGNLVIELREG